MEKTEIEKLGDLAESNYRLYLNEKEEKNLLLKVCTEIRDRDKIKITKVTTESRPGAGFKDCIEQLLLAAIAFDCEAVLFHNEQEYTTTAKKIRATIK